VLLPPGPAADDEVGAALVPVLLRAEVDVLAELLPACGAEAVAGAEDVDARVPVVGAAPLPVVGAATVLLAVGAVRGAVAVVGPADVVLREVGAAAGPVGAVPPGAVGEAEAPVLGTAGADADGARGVVVPAAADVGAAEPPEPGAAAGVVGVAAGSATSSGAANRNPTGLPSRYSCTVSAYRAAASSRVGDSISGPALARPPRSKVTSPLSSVLSVTPPRVND